MLDVTSLLRDAPREAIEPLLRYAGEDVSHWFVEAPPAAAGAGAGAGAGAAISARASSLSLAGVTLKTHVDPDSNLRAPYTPEGAFLHTPVMAPSTGAAVVATPWWQDDKLVVGALTRAPRWFRLVNALTSQTDLVEFGGEETVGEMQAKFAASYNAHCRSYTWKALVGGVMRALDPAKTMADNGVVDDSAELERIGLDPRDAAHVVDIMLLYNDDLTVA